MNLDELKTPWQSMQQQCDTARIDEIAARVGSKMSRFDHSIRRRDTIENLAAVLVITVFSIVLASCNNWVTFAGAAIVVFSAVEVVIVLNVTRMYRPTPAGLPLAEHCRQEVEKVDRQIFLLRNIVWWYVGPLMLGCCVMAFADGPLIASGISCGFYIAVGLFVYWINQKAVAEQLLPLRQLLNAANDTFNENLIDNQLGDVE